MQIPNAKLHVIAYCWKRYAEQESPPTPADVKAQRMTPTHVRAMLEAFQSVTDYLTDDVHRNDCVLLDDAIQRGLVAVENYLVAQDSANPLPPAP